MKSLLSILFLFLSIWSQQSWLDPNSFPNALKCSASNTNIIAEYIRAYTGYPTPKYIIRTSPKIPYYGTGINPIVRYYSPVIDGILEDSIWNYAETLLVNSWEDAEHGSACIDNKFTGPADFHAIWRFCYNHYGLYVSCEVHDDVYDVDSIGDWNTQDGVEIGIDPFSWGSHSGSIWHIDSLWKYQRQYVFDNNTMRSYDDNSHLAFLRIMKRAIDEPYLAGKIRSQFRFNFGKGNESNNFTIGDSALHGINFAAKKHGIDKWGRTIVHYEFKFPYDGTLWEELRNIAFFDGSSELANGAMLPASGHVFKIDISNIDDDIPGPDGSYSNTMLLGRRRNSAGFDYSWAPGTNCSDNFQYMVIQYGGYDDGILVAPVDMGTQINAFSSLRGIKSSMDLQVSVFPNPFNPSTLIKFSVPESKNTSIAIFDTKGIALRTLINEKVNKGEHSIEFNGKDNGGNNLSSGIFICRMVSGSYTHNIKLIMLK